MKKLMIAMSAAAMMSLCAQAIPQGGTRFVPWTGTDFNSYTENDGVWDPTADDNGGSTYGRYWTGGGSDSSTSIEVKTEGGSDKYLKVDEPGELTRKIKVDTDNNSAVIPQTVSADSGIYFSSKVQFTAADDAPEVTEDVDKIIVWAKAPADDDPVGTKTNLMVTALDLVDGTNKVYDTGVAITADQWYTLDIVAAAQNADSPIAFTVSLDGTSVGTFNSMVLANITGATTISSASFKGTGAVDDIDWGTVAAAEPVDVTLSVGDGVTLYDYATKDEFSGSKVSGVPGSTVKLLVEAPASGYTVTNATIADGEGEYSEFAVITITVEENLTVTISAGSGPQPVAVDFTVIPEGVTVNGLGNAYYVGDKINPSMLSATSSDPTKRAVVTVKVNGSVITNEYTLQAGDVLVVEVTEEYITFALTLPNVDNATPTVTSNDVVVADISAIVTGTVVTVTWTADQNYKITAGATETITMDGPKTAAVPTVAEDSEDFYPTYIEGTSDATKAKYKEWATTYEDDLQSANLDAYLLNCAPNAEAVAAAKAAFKFTSITPGEIPTIDGTGYNGVVVILGGTSLSDIATWDAATTNDTFFKATLVVEAPAPAQD